MDGIVVINIGDILTTNCRSSFISAANRWGCGYRELTDIYLHQYSHLHPSSLKLKVLGLVNWDRILIVDADTLISTRAPNPFKIYKERKEEKIVLHAAINNQPQFRKKLIPHLISEQELDLKTVAKHWEYYQKPINQNNTTIQKRSYFNCGVMLVENIQLAKDIFSLAFDMYEQLADNLIFIEQSVVNYIFRHYSMPVGVLDTSWNYCIPDRFSWPLPNHPQYIYHFAGYDGKQRVLEKFNWRDN